MLFSANKKKLETNLVIRCNGHSRNVNEEVIPLWYKLGEC
ncbi:hypothetical protein SPPR111872_12745 [Sphingobacterium prati]